MGGGPRSIVIDARVNGFPRAHGIARSVMQLIRHMPQADDGLALRVLVNPGRPQLFPLSELPPQAGVIRTDITFGAVHRCWELARLIRAAGAAVLYVPYPLLTPLICPCPLVVTIHDCTIEGDVRFAGGWHWQAWLKLATRLVLRRAAATTAPTWASLDEVRLHYPSAPHLAMVPNGVETPAGSQRSPPPPWLRSGSGTGCLGSSSSRWAPAGRTRTTISWSGPWRRSPRTSRW